MDIHVTKTELDGVLIVDTDFFRDERGFFIEAYHRQRFAAAGIAYEFVQDNHSRSGAKVLRGFHYQDMTAPMAKLVRCTAGAILDVAVDLRVGSPTFGRWAAVELNARDMRQLLVPEGFGHAFATLSETAEVHYKCAGYYTPPSEGTVAWDDPAIAVDWPYRDPVLSTRDRQGMSLDEYRARPAFRWQDGRTVAARGS